MTTLDELIFLGGMMFLGQKFDLFVLTCILYRRAIFALIFCSLLLTAIQQKRRTNKGS